jgi:hypothetical protein
MWVLSEPLRCQAGNTVREKTSEVNVFHFLRSKTFAFEQSYRDSLNRLPSKRICHELLSTDTKVVEVGFQFAI